MPDFMAMPKGAKRSFWWFVYRIKHCRLWCSWCRKYGSWAPMEGKPDCHADAHNFWWRVRYAFYGWHVTGLGVDLWWEWSSQYEERVYKNEDPSDMVHEEISAFDYDIPEVE